MDLVNGHREICRQAETLLLEYTITKQDTTQTNQATQAMDMLLEVCRRAVIISVVVFLSAKAEVVQIV
tara:strand:+ start:217 stop:420 length:204 start_codon:yes stop_codon:yes gene_type:complete